MKTVSIDRLCVHIKSENDSWYINGYIIDRENDTVTIYIEGGKTRIIAKEDIELYELTDE